MSAMNRFQFTATLIALIGATGCAGDVATAPAAIDTGARLSSLGLAGNADVLTRSRPLASDITVSKEIGPEGGSLELPQTGLTLVVPPGAVMRRITFTVTALGGELVAYEFGPHGSRFPVPLRVTQRIQGVDLGTLDQARTVKAAYFQDRTRLDYGLRRAEIDELLPARLDLGAGRITFQVRHFSGYMVSSGNVKGNGNGPKGPNGPRPWGDDSGPSDDGDDLHGPSDR